jgi:hypothetical protein
MGWPIKLLWEDRAKHSRFKIKYAKRFGMQIPPTSHLYANISVKNKDLADGLSAC